MSFKRFVRLLQFTVGIQSLSFIYTYIYKSWLNVFSLYIFLLILVFSLLLLYSRTESVWTLVHIWERILKVTSNVMIIYFVGKPSIQNTKSVVPWQGRSSNVIMAGMLFMRHIIGVPYFNKRNAKTVLKLRSYTLAVGLTNPHKTECFKIYFLFLMKSRSIWI